MSCMQPSYVITCAVCSLTCGGDSEREKRCEIPWRCTSVFVELWLLSDQEVRQAGGQSIIRYNVPCLLVTRSFVSPSREPNARVKYNQAHIFVWLDYSLDMLLGKWYVGRHLNRPVDEALSHPQLLVAPRHIIMVEGNTTWQLIGTLWVVRWTIWKILSLRQLAIGHNISGRTSY